MKTTKRITAILFAVVMAAAMCFTAFAANPTGSITVKNATTGKDYSVYKIFDATYSGDNASYTVDSVSNMYWYEKAAAADSPFTLTQINGGTIYNVMLKTGKALADVEAWCNANIEGATAAETITAADTTVKFEGLSYGYYFVKSSLGAVVTINNVNTDVEVIDKNMTPGWGDEGGKFADKTTANVGDKVTYTVKVNNALNYTGKDSVKEYVVQDIGGSTVLVNFHTITVKVNGTELKKGWVEGMDRCADLDTNPIKGSHAIGSDTTATSKTDADWYVANNNNTDHVFYLHINWQNADGSFKFDKQPNTIEISYESTMQPDTSNGSREEEFINTAKIGWIVGNNDPYYPDSPKEAKVKSYAFGLYKTDKSAGGKALEGAEFELKVKDGATAISVVPSNKYPGLYYLNNETALKSVSEDERGEATTTLITPKDGKISIVGLAGGEYVLTETKAPEGYNRLTSDIKVELNNTNATSEIIKSDLKLNSVCNTQVVNQAGSMLPETGGIGTVIFIVIGALAVLGTGIFLVTNKRMSKESF